MVREVTFEDLDSMLELYLFLHEKSIPEHDEHLAEIWEKILTDEDYHLIVNEVDGKIVSSCTCIIIPNLTWNVRPYAFVENVVTHGDYRKCGYARACLDYAKSVAQGADCYKIFLMTGAKDAETLGFYEHAGYNSGDKTGFIQWL